MEIAPTFTGSSRGRASSLDLTTWEVDCAFVIWLRTQKYGESIPEQRLLKEYYRHPDPTYQHLYPERAGAL